MQYALVKTYTTGNELYKLYDDYKQAERKLKKSFSENGKILEIPQISSGLKLYRQNGSLYGVIVKETKNLWFTDNPYNPEDAESPILKETMIDKWFVSGFLKDGIEEYHEDYINNYYKEEDENEEEILDELTRESEE